MPCPYDRQRCTTGRRSLTARCANVWISAGEGMDDQIAFLHSIARRLDSAGIPYMMTGSMALALYAVPRMTRDIDLVVEVAEDRVADLCELFAGDCYIVRRAVTTQGMFNIIQNELVIKADFIIRKDAAYRKEEFARRRKIDIEGVPVSVVAPEDLILSKLVWGKDSASELQLRDVRQIVMGNGSLDWPYLEKWAALLDVAEMLVKARTA